VHSMDALTSAAGRNPEEILTNAGEIWREWRPQSQENIESEV